MYFRVSLIIWLFGFQSTWKLAAQVAFSETFAKEALRNEAALAFSWNAAGDKLAYYEHGAIWVINILKGTRKSVKNFNSADGCNILWSSSASSVVWACPMSLTSIDLNTGQSKDLLTSTSLISDVQASPDGSVISFVLDHNLASIRTSGGEVRPITTAGKADLLLGKPDPLYAREFHLERAYWWAPDSSAVAYLETDRTLAGAYPQAGKPLPLIKLKVLTLSSGKVVEVASGSTDQPYFAGVVWLPDSKKVAYQVLNRLQNQLDMSIYDTVSAASRLIYSDKDAYWVNLPGTPVFIDGGTKFVITSERTGSRHAYLYATDGKQEADLTPGKMEVTGPLQADQAARQIYFSALTDAMRDLRLFRCGFGGENQELLTKEDGWHETSISPNKLSYLDRISTSNRPPAVVLRHMDGSEVAVLSSATPGDVPSTEFSRIKLHSEVELPVMTWKPSGFDPARKYPVIVYTFSGPSGHVVKNAWGGWQNAWNRAMSQKGYVIVAVDARGSGGYGHYFEEYIHYRLGAQEVADLREVFSYLARLPYVDAKRIGIWGCDYGAHVVVHAMFEFPNGFAAGFADSPITDWRLYNAYFVERYLGLPARRIIEYNDSSALDNAKRLRGKLLVAESPADEFIRQDQLVELQKALEKVQKPLEVVSFPKADYHVEPSSLAKLMNRMTDFFASSL